MSSLPAIDARIQDVWLEAKLSGVERAILRDLIDVRGYLERYGGHRWSCPQSSPRLPDARPCDCGWDEINGVK